MAEGKNRIGSDERSTTREASVDFGFASGAKDQENASTLPLREAPPRSLYATLIDNRFEIISEIGRGGIGIAYLANDRCTQNMPVVIKALLEQPDPKEKQWV